MPARRSFLFVLACALTALGAACEPAPAALDEGAYRREVEAWRGERLQELTGDAGWLTLSGLHWLKEGESRVGSGQSNEIVLQRADAPAYVGSLFVEGKTVRFEAAEGAGVTTKGEPVAKLELKTDAGGAPTVLELGSLTFQLIERGGQIGFRVRDREHPARARFKGLETYPLSLGWRVAARFEPYEPPKTVPILNVLGMTQDQPSPGALVFEAEGRTHRLDALTEGDKLFVIFADETSGKETYGGGRYLYAPKPDAQGRVVLDFNKAHSPPCAFTDFATCPLPPPQNRLAVKVEAGEKHAGALH